MSFTTYDASVPALRQMLKSVLHFLNKLRHMLPKKESMPLHY